MIDRGGGVWARVRANVNGHVPPLCKWSIVVGRLLGKIDEYIQLQGCDFAVSLRPESYYILIGR